MKRVLAALLASSFCAGPFAQHTEPGPAFEVKDERRADEAMRIIQTREIAIGRAAPGASHALRLSVHVFRGGSWSEGQAEAAVLASARLLEQCRVSLSRAELRVVEAPPRFRVYSTALSRELLRRMPVGKPAIFFVDDTLNDPAFEAEAIGRANAATRPELADTIWVVHGARDLPQVLAHELVHLLSDSGAHSEEPENLARAETSPRNTRLTDAQCELLRSQAQANGLLTKTQP
ncbi:MAG: hypothetical protein ACREQZ_15695 [Woeseiaceae bacterium]